MPANGTPEEPPGGKLRQGLCRYADPLSADRHDDHPAERDGQARQVDDHRALHADKEQARRVEERSALPVHVFGHAGRRYHGGIHRQDLPHARARQADLDHRRLGGAVRSHLDCGRGAQPAGVRLCHLGARGKDPADPAGLRRGAPLCAQREERRRLLGRQNPLAHRQGRPQIWRCPGADHPAALRSCRGRALAVRHDHLDAAQQRARPGLRQGGHARRRARISRIRSRRCAIANASFAARAFRCRCGSNSTSSRNSSDRHPKTRHSPSCGTARAAKRRWSSAPSSAGAPTAANHRSTSLPPASGLHAGDCPCASRRASNRRRTGSPRPCRWT